MKYKLVVYILLFILLSSSVYAVVSHSASEVVAGTFQAGTYTFQDNLIVDDNVGIGTNNPADNLHIFDDIAEDVSIRLENDNEGASAESRLHLRAGAEDAYLSVFGNSAGRKLTLDARDVTMPITFEMQGSEKVRIADDGKVGIGMTSPTEKLHVNGSINVTTGNDVCIEGGNCLSSVGGGSSLWTNSSGNATYTAGRVGIGTTTPQSKLSLPEDSGISWVRADNSIEQSITSSSDNLIYKTGRGSGAHIWEHSDEINL